MSEADRESVAARTLTAYGDGLLTTAEADERLDAVYAARTWDELRELVESSDSARYRPAADASVGVAGWLVVPVCVAGTALALWTAPGGYVWKLLLAGAGLLTGALAVWAFRGEAGPVAVGDLERRHVR